MIVSGNNYPVPGRYNRKVLDMRPMVASKPAAAEFSYSLYRFGFTPNATDINKVDIKAGSIFKGKATPLSVVAATVTIAELSYVYVECDMNITAATIGVQVGLPVHDDTYLRTTLFRFSLVGGVATLQEVCHLGNIDYTTIYMANT